MQIQEIRCSHFRCLDAVTWRPGPGLNLIRGENAQGKTSLLEAILYTATSKSHRTSVESELVQHGSAEMHTSIEAARSDRTLKLECHWHGGQKRVRVNGVAQTRMSDLLGKLAVVLFSPEDVQLVKAGAGVRRRFLDMEIAQVSPPYLQALQHYRQALRQRNELLRRGRGEDAQLAPWEQQLCAHAEVIVAQRQAFVEELSERAVDKYDAIAQKEALALRFEPDVPTATKLAEVLESTRESDRRRRVTQRGPHRDDMGFFLGEQSARSCASQGQQKSIILAIKFAQVDLIHSRLGEYPVLMLDEVLAELDARRAGRLLQAVDPAVQCLMTTTQIEDGFLSDDREQQEFLIEDGQIRAFAPTPAG